MAGPLLSYESKHQRYLGIKKCSGAKWDMHTKLDSRAFVHLNLFCLSTFFQFQYDKCVVFNRVNRHFNERLSIHDLFYNQGHD